MHTYPLLTGAHIVRLQNPPVPDWPLKAYTLIMVLAPHPKAKGEKTGILEGCLDSTYPVARGRDLRGGSWAQGL